MWRQHRRRVLIKHDLEILVVIRRGKKTTYRGEKIALEYKSASQNQTEAYFRKTCLISISSFSLGHVLSCSIVEDDNRTTGSYKATKTSTLPSTVFLQITFDFSFHNITALSLLSFIYFPTASRPKILLFILLTHQRMTHLDSDGC